ncbi:MFS transporter [Bacillus sp. CECT 9360]|uniref:MFS transporter n=1 Tax=Bacillus sp. CECT 9360 TaxID=2845821 RepID=UPI001E4D06F9|nr:MFS transporter [Bacillus sp. CECT 9360]CAH0345361.1 Staphylopine export protein [Bacillus sp. CECT 9360]
MSGQKLWTKNFISIAIANFFVFATFYYLLVTLPLYALEELHGNEMMAGLITTSFLISAIIIRPFAGKWISRVGKYPVLMTSLLILSLASTLYFFPHSVTALIALRFCHGIGFGMATTAAGAIVADLIPDSRKGEGMGYYGLAQNLGMVIGPFLGLTVMQMAGTNTMFTINVLSSLTALIAGLFIRLPKDKAVATDGVKVQHKGIFEKTAIPVSLVSAFFGLAYSAIISFVSVYAREIGLVEASSYFFVVYAVVLLISRPFTGKWFDKYGANVIIYPAIICFAIGTLLLSLASSAAMFLLAAAFIGIGWGTVFPSLQTIAIQVAPTERRALATATFLSIFDFGFGIGSFMFGLATSKIDHGSLYFYSSFLVVLGLFVYYLLHGRNSGAISKGAIQRR